MNSQGQKIFLIIIILAGFFAYINAYQNQFLWDDEFNIQRNVFIRSFSNISKIFTTNGGAGAGRLDNFYRPVKLIAYTIVYSIFGLQPWPFHLLNVCLHIANALLILFLINKIFKKELLGFFTALLWVVHPTHTEAITYISATQEPLCLFFGLVAFIFYINFRTKKKLSLLIFSLCCFALALLSKESIIILPVLFCAYELVSISEKTDWKQYKYILPFFTLAGFYFFLRLTVLNFGGTLNLYEASNIYTQHISFRIYTFLASLLHYYSFIFAPINLRLERQFPIFVSFLNPQVFTSFCLLILFFFIVYKSLKSQKRYFAFGILWFFISFIPMSGIIPLNAFILEHWLYIPLIGFFLAISGLVCELITKKPKAKNLIIFIFALAVFVLMSMTFLRNKDWKDPITFYNNILQYNQGTARLHNNLAMAYVDNDEIEMAKIHYGQAIEISDIYPETHYNLARLFISENKIDIAIQHLEKSIELNPNFFFSYELLGNIYEFQGNKEKAQEYYQKAQEIKYY